MYSNTKNGYHHATSILCMFHDDIHFLHSNTFIFFCFTSLYFLTSDIVHLSMCACVCLFPSTISFFLTEQSNKCNVRVQVTDGMLRKYFWIKDFCVHIKDYHRKNLQTSNCAKESQLNRDSHEK